MTKKRILGIDDCEDNLITLGAIVSDAFPNSEFSHALSGMEGIRIAAHWQPDVILLDIVMPQMDGFETCRRIKGDVCTAGIPVIFFTALREDLDLRLTALEAGAEAFLAKPIDIAELTAQINAMFRIRDAELAKKDEHRRLEQMVRERTAALERLNAELAQAQKMESIGRLAGGIAHDFNNMLAVILGQAELAIDELTDHNPVTYRLREIQTAARHSADLTKQLLAFARKQTIAPRVLDLNTTVEGMLKMLSRLIGERTELIWRPGLSTGTVKMDPVQIDQILANLCINARDAMENGGSVTITTERTYLDSLWCSEHPGSQDGWYAVIEVSDTGCGMDERTLQSIFEPFFTTKETGKGTGLGLSTVYGIVKQNDGYIDVESVPGVGSIFRVFIPSCQAVQTDGDYMHDHDADIPCCEGKVILLVEDEPILLEMTVEMLKSLGCKVIDAASPREALHIIESDDFEIDLLITDMVMPEMNGVELASCVANLHPDAACLFMSGYTEDEITKNGQLAEGIKFIHKPFSRQDLAQAVQETIRAKQRENR